MVYAYVLQIKRCVTYFFFPHPPMSDVLSTLQEVQGSRFKVPSSDHRRILILCGNQMEQIFGASRSNEPQCNLLNTYHALLNIQ